jgi:hypothetical protein
MTAGEVANRLEPDVRGQHDERCRDQLLGPALGRAGGGARVRHQPENDDARRRLDQAVDAEADQRDGARHHACRDSDRRLDQVPAEADPGEAARPAHEPRARGRGRTRRGGGQHCEWCPGAHA